MRNFQRLLAGVNVTVLLHQINRQPELWNAHTLRTKHPNTPHAEVDDIWLRFNDMAEIEAAEPGSQAERDAMLAITDQHESINYSGFAKIPAAREIVFGLMAAVQGERLGRVIVTRLRPGASISPHVDSGDHAAYYDRHQLLLQCLPGCTFRAGNEYAPMVTGEMWWFDNSQEHEVVNNSNDDRLALIIDIRCSRC